MNTTCKNCGKRFRMRQWNQFYCGSKTKKTGCSYRMQVQRVMDYNRLHNKEYLKNYVREWVKVQRKNNTAYAIRQRKFKREYAQKLEKKEIAKKWRHKNIKKVLQWNRLRIMKKKGIIGFHTDVEWQELKEYNHLRCLKCGKTEADLKKQWKGTQFKQLTRDHIVPISRGGTDYIWNIQPLCVSCNSRKHNIKNGKIVAVSMGADPFHIGHLHNIQDAKKLGDRLIVILNNDNWLMNKKGYVFMPENERARLIMAFRGVDGVLLTKHVLGDGDVSVARELEILKPDIFAKGGDRNISNIPESERMVCEKYNIKIVNGVGGEKIQSSSWLIEKSRAWAARLNSKN